MSDSDATKDEKKTEEASGELTNDQQVIDLVETENQAEKEQQDDEKVTEVPKVEDGQDTVGENKTSEEVEAKEEETQESQLDRNSNEKSATEDAEDGVSNEIREDKVTEEGEISQAESKQENVEEAEKQDEETAPEIQLQHLDANATPPPYIPEVSDVILEEEEEEKENEDIKMEEEEEDDLLREEEELAENIESPDQPVYDREQLLTLYKEALEERSRIQNMNQQYQTKLVEYFKKKKTDEKAPEIEKNVTDQEQRYLKYMSNLEELQASESRQATSIESQLKELKEKCQEKQDKIEEASKEFVKFKYDTGKVAINSRSGKSIPQKDLDQYQLFEGKKEQEVIAVRLENIKLKNRLKKREMQLKAKEELAEGLHLIDFEQLKIENQTYNEKIEERNEELLKLRKKITTTVQVLTHLKEKLQFVQGENTEQRLQLKEIDVTVAQFSNHTKELRDNYRNNIRRDVLTKLKQARDALRIDNTKLKHKSGLLGNEPLLRDFEERKDEGEELRTRLARLKEEHVEINMNLNALKKKIEKSKY